MTKDQAYQVWRQMLARFKIVNQTRQCGDPELEYASLMEIAAWDNYSRLLKGK